MGSANIVTQFSTPNKAMPEGNKIWVLEALVGSNRPTTNFPEISVDQNRFNRLVEKSGLGAERRRESPVIKMGFHFVRSKTGVWCVESVSGI